MKKERKEREREKRERDKRALSYCQIHAPDHQSAQYLDLHGSSVAERHSPFQQHPQHDRERVTVQLQHKVVRLVVVTMPHGWDKELKRVKKVSENNDTEPCTLR